MKDGIRWKFIYDQINGALAPDVCEWVKDETSEDGELASLIKEIYEARNRISDRVGVDPAGDEDFEQLVGGFEEFSQVCGKLMYRYGYQDGVNTMKKSRS